MKPEKQTQALLETILRPGQIVGGKYCVDKLIGKGGMAAVWAGVNQRTGKRIALKVILRSFASSGDAAELFRREAMAASRVNHPNVVNVFDVIDHEGMTCIVMELLDGEPFGTYLTRKGYLNMEEAVALLLPAMRGVAAANVEGVVHRDLKPQNIFLCIGPDGRLVTTKVLDFGISVIVERALDDSGGKTQLTTHGTPAYMCPEHITGAPNIDSRADVYGFGVLFYEALTGQLPFLGDPGPALLVRILNEPAPKITLFRPDLPPAMVEIIDRAMAKNPELRFPSLDHFIRAIEERILPSSNLPRTMTPMMGVPLFTSSEPLSGVADPIVQVMYRSEGSGEREIKETKALFTLSREEREEEAAKRAEQVERSEETPYQTMIVHRTGEVPPPTTTQVNLRPSIGRDVRRLFRHRAITGAVFMAVIGLVVWLALPMPSSRRTSVVKSDPPPAATMPSTTPVPVKIEMLEPTPPPELEQKAEPEEEPVASDAPVTDSKWSKGKATRASAKNKLAHVTAKPSPSQEASTWEPHKNKPISPTKPSKSTVPRAGSLSPDDF
jgi:hypothetical protein